VLIDRQGQIRAYYDGQALDLDQVERDVRQLLARPTWRRCSSEAGRTPPIQ